MEYAIALMDEGWLSSKFLYNGIMQTVLIVEDEKRIAHWVRSYFEEAGFVAVVTDNGRSALHLARQQKPDLIILDIMLPGMNGMDVCKTIRKESTVPIIMLTAKGQEIDRILGLELGADDYVVKPFSPNELVARARAVLRRANGEMTAAPSQLCGGTICLDADAYACMVDGETVELSRTQFNLLHALLKNKGRAMTRSRLLDAAFAGDYDGFDRTIDVHIRRLRRRIEADPANPRHIVTVFGVGYKFIE